MAPDSIWEIVFLMVILKIPIVYLCVVVYYAIKAKPDRAEGAGVAVRTDPGPPSPGWGRSRRRRPQRPRRPHGGPARVYARTPRTALARARRTASR